jgi:hypothetical protein
VLSNEFENVIVLAMSSIARSRNIRFRPISTQCACCPLHRLFLDLFMWLSFRCFSAKGEETIPLCGGLGLAVQLGNVEYARPRKFREKLQEWLQVVKGMWPECPARISPDGRRLLIRPAAALPARSA